MYAGSLPTATNREDYEPDVIQLADSDTGDLIDLSSATIIAELRDRDHCKCVTLTQDGGQITLPELNTIKIIIPRDAMTGLCAGEYEFGLTVENAGLTKSYIVGRLPVIDGVVRK